MARNHTGNGVRVSWKIVPAVTEVWQPHPAHCHRSRTGHAFPDPQRGQRKPVGHRSRVRYARHASSVPKSASSSARFRGYSSAIPAHYILGLPESSRYPTRRFLIFKEFYAAPAPVVVCEGKTDTVYLTQAIRSMAARYSALAG